MNNKLNFVFCFDQNYDKQAEIAIYSLLECVNEDIDISIIHSKTANKNFLSNKIKNHKKLNNLYIYYFDEKKHIFPNIKNTHVSEATYYRFFLEKYLQQDSEYIIYLDTDIVCINNPVIQIKEEIEKLNKSNKLFGACLEIEPTEDLEVFSRLNMDSSYFNAGVLIINFKLWREGQIGEKLLKHMKKISNKIVLWDQDVMNSFFNGNYIQISKELNFCTSTNLDYRKNFELISKNTMFFHYSGKIKPWYIKGTDSKFAEFYHSNYRNIYPNQSYHLVFRNRKLDAINLVSLIISFKIFNLKFPFKFFFKSLGLIFNKN